MSMDKYEWDKMPPKVQEKYLEVIRNMPPAKKFRLVLEWCDANRSIMMSGIRSACPNMSEEEIRRQLIKRILPSDIVEKVYGW